MHVQVHAVLGGTLAQLPALLKADAALRAEAVEQLMALATPGRVRALMANAALGKVWRAVAAFRKYDDRVQELCNRFSCAVQGDAEMRAWVEASYNMQARRSPPPSSSLRSCSNAAASAGRFAASPHAWPCQTRTRVRSAHAWAAVEHISCCVRRNAALPHACEPSVPSTCMGCAGR